MTATHDPDRLIAAYLEPGPTILASESYVAVDARIRYTRQRGRWATSWTVPITSRSRAIVAVAAVLVVTVTGVSILRVIVPNGSSMAPPSAQTSASGSPSPTSSAVARAAATDDPLTRTFRWPGDAKFGGYETSFGWDPRFVFQFFLENDWTASDRGVRRDDAVSISFFPIDAVVSDPCSRSLAPRASPWSSTVVATELAKVIPLEKSSNHPLASGRGPGRYTQYTLQVPKDCPASQFALFKTPDPRCPADVCGGVSPPWVGMDLGAVTTHAELFLTDVDGQVMAIQLEWTDQATPDDLAERDAILESYRLLTPTDSRSTAP